MKLLIIVPALTLLVAAATSISCGAGAANLVQQTAAAPVPTCDSLIYSRQSDDRMDTAIITALPAGGGKTRAVWTTTQQRYPDTISGTVKSNGLLFLSPSLLSVYDYSRFCILQAHPAAWYPDDMKAGQNLPDASLVWHNPEPSCIAGATVQMTLRRVMALEHITTAAGAWYCYRISYRLVVAVKRNCIPQSPVPPAHHTAITEVTEWYAPHTGIIRWEADNSSGILIRVVSAGNVVQ